MLLPVPKCSLSLCGVLRCMLTRCQLLISQQTTTFSVYPHRNKAGLRQSLHCVHTSRLKQTRLTAKQQHRRGVYSQRLFIYESVWRIVDMSWGKPEHLLHVDCSALLMIQVPCLCQKAQKGFTPASNPPKRTLMLAWMQILVPPLTSLPQYVQL